MLLLLFHGGAGGIAPVGTAAPAVSMRQDVRRPIAQSIGTPPPHYDQQYMLTLTRTLSAWMGQVANQREGYFPSMPQSGGGLIIGRLWVDLNGFVHLVQAKDVLISGLSVKISLGVVSVS